MTQNENKISERKKPATVRDWMEEPEFKLQISRALPKHVTPDRFIRVALTTLLTTPKLQECFPPSVLNCLLKCSSLGIEPDGRRAHLIPFWNGKANRSECQLIIDYKGLAELVRRSGDVSYIHADVVREKDSFEFVFGSGAKLIHKPSLDRDRGQIICAYSFVKLKDGSEDFDVMSVEDVEEVRDKSQNYRKAKEKGFENPWDTAFPEMAKKGLCLSTPIPTISGWTTMGEIRQGDVVFDVFGKPTNVLGVSEIKNIQCFRVNFSNGDSIVCDDEHRWLARVGKSDAAKKPYSVLTINDLYESKINGLSVTIPVQGALKLPENKLLIDPYILGYWLGNGSKRAANFSCHISDESFLCNKIESSKYLLGKVRRDLRSKGVCIGIKEGLLLDLKALGVFQNKHVPKEYLRGSYSQRLSLLQGLMDSDGHIDKDRGRCHFYNTNELLANAVEELVLSLGDIPHIGKKLMKGFDVTCEAFFVGWFPSICPCLVPRKASRFVGRKIAKYRAISSIQMVESVPTRCIAVDSSTHTYLAGKSMAPTHNTVFRRHSKWLPLSPEVKNGIEIDDDVIDLPKDDTPNILLPNKAEVPYALNDSSSTRLAEALAAQMDAPSEAVGHIKDQNGSRYVEKNGKTISADATVMIDPNDLIAPTPEDKARKALLEQIDSAQVANGFADDELRDWLIKQSMLNKTSARDIRGVPDVVLKSIVKALPEFVKTLKEKE